VIPGSRQLCLSHQAKRSLRRIQITFNGCDGLVMGVNSTVRLESNVGTKYRLAVNIYGTTSVCCRDGGFWNRGSN